MVINASLVVLGLIIGAVVNYLADVLPIFRKFSQPVCLQCQKTLTWENYLFAVNCHHCGRKYSFRRWIVLLIFGAIPNFLWYFPPERFSLWAALLILSYLALIFIIDMEYRAILNPTVLVGVVIFFVFGVILHGVWVTVLGGAAGYLIMLALHLLGHFLSQWLAKKRGQELDEPALGFGDVNFAGVMGLGLGWPGITAGLMLAIILGGLFSGLYLLYTLLAKRYRLFLAIPYAPFMVFAIIYLLFR